MAKKIVFNKSTIAGLPTPAKARVAYHDVKVRGLAIMVSPSGGKVFYLYRWIQNKPQRIRIGLFPQTSVEAARDRAADLNGQIAKGADLAAERRAARSETTLAELFTAYIEKHAKAHKRSWKGDEYLYKKHLKPWAGRRLSSIASADVSGLHVSMKDRPYQANRMLALLSTMFGFAMKEGWPGPNPCRGVTRFREESRDRFLSPDEMKRFLSAVQDEPDMTIRDLIYVLLYTGVRRSNAMAMRWDDLDLPHAVWRITGEKSKSGRPMIVVLPRPAVQILQTRTQDRNASEWVFPSCNRKQSATGHVTEIRVAWERVLDRANIADLRLHDLRRTLGSWQACLGASMPIIGASLGHSSPDATAVYARLQVDPVRESVENAVSAMLAVNGKPARKAKSKRKSERKGKSRKSKGYDNGEA